YLLSTSFFFSSRRPHTIFSRDWSSDVCSADLGRARRGWPDPARRGAFSGTPRPRRLARLARLAAAAAPAAGQRPAGRRHGRRQPIGRASCSARDGSSVLTPPFRTSHLAPTPLP